MLPLIGAACNGTHEHSFVERLGTDTLLMETFTHSADFIEGTVIVRNPATRLGRYRADIGVDGIERLEVSWRTPETNPSGPPDESSIVTFTADSITMVKTGGRNPGTITVARDGTVIPRAGAGAFSFGLFEYLGAVAAESGNDEFAYSTVQAGSPRIASNTVIRRDGNTVTFGYFGNPMKMSFENGHIVGRSGDETTMKVEGEMTEAFNIEALALDFAARDAAGEGIGTPSPGATVQASAAGANFEVVYSQPAKRGREIFGNLVPFGEVWRMGANAATHFTTDRDLVATGETIPANTYTLWATFTEEEATLIVNSQTRQWGTQYDAEQDFVRLPLQMATLDESVERFTMDVTEVDGKAVLSLAWDRTMYFVEFEVR